MGFSGGSDGKESAYNAGDLGSVPGLAKPLEKGMATHSSIPTWKIPWTEETGGLQSIGLQRSDMSEQTGTPLFLPREFHGQRRLVGYSPLGCKDLDMTEQLNSSTSSSSSCNNK